MIELRVQNEVLKGKFIKEYLRPCNNRPSPQPGPKDIRFSMADFRWSMDKIDNRTSTIDNHFPGPGRCAERQFVY